MSTGADAKTMPSSREFCEGHERIYGKDKRPQRGRWIQDPKTGKLVPASEYVSPSSDAKNAPIMVDRFMEGASTQDGVDIGSRRKRRDYMKATGSADASDYSGGYFEKRRAAQDKQTQEATRKTVSEVAKLDRRHLPKFIEEGKKR